MGKALCTGMSFNQILASPKMKKALNILTDAQGRFVTDDLVILKSADLKPRVKTGI